jgi:hypothetical protein
MSGELSILALARFCTAPVLETTSIVTIVYPC